MAFDFQWNAAKAAANLRKHGVSFSEAATAFRDPLSATIEDEPHSGEEQRYVLFGISERGRLLAVMHTERDEVIRIISARKATRAEQQEYEDDEL
jgi:uncharacterized DUF497 family protein